MSVEIYFAIASFITFAIFVLTLLRARSQAAATEEEEEKPAATARRPVPVAPRDVRGRVRRRAPQRQQRQNEAEAHQRDVSSDEWDDDEVIDEIDPFDTKIGAKKRKKLEEKAAKKEAREAELREREERKQREEKREEERKKQDERDKEQEKKQEELEKKRKEEQEKKEQEEYEAMKAAFMVEEEGYEEKDDEGDEQNQLQKFISHIKAAKVVVLEDLASLFRMKTQDVIDRISALQEEGSLTGVIDDRGKFIYIHEEELRAVAKFIRQRGRVSITELADASNSFINLTPDESHLLPAEA